MQEQKYARCQREPLGKSIMRNYNFPEIIQDNKFRFGVETIGSKIKICFLNHNKINKFYLFCN